MIWWPILVMVGFYIIGFLVDLRILFYYEHPDDGKYNQGLLAKAVSLAGLEMAWLLMSGLPTDAFNTYLDGGMDFYFFWSVAFLFTAMYLIIPLPFAVYMYEADSDPRISQTPGWKKALCMTAIVVVVAALALGIGYAVMSTAHVPFDQLVCREMIPDYITGNETLTLKDPTCGAAGGVHKKTMAVDVAFFEYLAAYMAFIGYWLFVLFAGVGIVALPVDLIFGYIDRPRPIDLDSFKEQKRGLGEKATALKAVGQKIKQREISLRDASGFGAFKQKTLLKSELKKFRQSVFLLEKDFKELNISLKERGENPFVSYTRLTLGIISAIFSVVWFLHIVLYAGVAYFIPSVPGILNQLLNAVRKSELYFLDLITFSILIAYLLCTVVKGCFKFGMRIFFCFPIHPMRKDDTRLNSFLFNVAMIVLASCALTHFSWQCFRDYAHGTALDWIFGVRGNYLPLCGVFYQYALFTWMLCAVSVITAVVLGIKPRDRSAIGMGYNLPAAEEAVLSGGDDTHATGVPDDTGMPS